MFLDAPICHPWYNGGGLDMLTDATGLRGVIAKFPRVGPLLQALMDQVRCRARGPATAARSEEHTSELQSP